MSSRNQLTIFAFMFYLIIGSLNSDNSLLAHDRNKTLKIGDVISIESKVLDETRQIFVSTPFGYENSNEKYPILYILDGGTNFEFAASVVNFLSRIQRIPQTIVVGIPNTKRTRDFSPVKINDRVESGGADNFINFLNNELFPYIDKNYRTENYKTLFGHSLCGMFSIYTLFSNPDLFNSFIAVSPYLQFQEEYVLNKVESILENQTNFNKDIYITLGNEPDYMPSIARMEELFNTKVENLSWELSIRDNEDHASIPLKSLYDGLEFIYSNWRLKNETAMKGLGSIKDHYSDLTDKYGYQIIPTEMIVNVVGYRLLQSNQLEKAIEVFKYNVELYPKSANVYDSLGEAQEAAGQIINAKENYKKALDIGINTRDQNINVYKKNLERVKSKI